MCGRSWLNTESDGPAYGTATAETMHFNHNFLSYTVSAQPNSRKEKCKLHGALKKNKKITRKLHGQLKKPKIVVIYLATRQEC